MPSWFDILNDNIPDNPFYDDGVVTIGDTGITYDTGLGSDEGGGYDPIWENLDELVEPDTENLYNLDDYRNESAIPWSWILGGGVVLILFYAVRR